MALNGSLVRKVEGEEAQIKDVPSLKRKSSHPSILNGCLKGRERGRRGERSVCAWKGERASAIQPPGRQEGCRDTGVFRTALTTRCHVPPERAPHAGYTGTRDLL